MKIIGVVVGFGASALMFRSVPFGDAGSLGSDRNAPMLHDYRPPPEALH